MLNVKVFVVVLIATCVLADMKDFKNNLHQSFAKCIKENPITDADRQLLRNKQLSDNDAVKCALACTYKQSGMMDDKGKFDVEQIKEKARENFGSDKENLQWIEEMCDTCKSVNDETVSDGDKGCERAALIFKCTMEKTKMGSKLFEEK